MGEQHPELEFINFSIIIIGDGPGIDLMVLSCPLAVAGIIVRTGGAIESGCWAMILILIELIMETCCCRRPSRRPE